MADAVETLEHALSLDVRDRAALAQRLLASLDELSEEEAEHLWAHEAQRRLEEYRAGGALAVPSEEVGARADLIVEVLRLPRTERARVAEEILSSLEERTDEVAVAWAKQIERRSQEVAEGRVQTVA